MLTAASCLDGWPNLSNAHRQCRVSDTLPFRLSHTDDHAEMISSEVHIAIDEWVREAVCGIGAAGSLSLRQA